MLDNLWRDFRFTLRSLYKRPLFAVVAILTLALGIGANTAIFTVVNAVLLAPLPFGDSEGLVQIWKLSSKTQNEKLPESVLNYKDLQQQTSTFEQVAAIRVQAFVMTDTDEPARINGARITANFFSTLKVPVYGRDFLNSDEEPGAQPVVILSYALWQSRYERSPQIVGRTLAIDGKNHLVIGVLPQGIYYPLPDTDLYVPMAFRSTELLRGSAFLRMLGRLKPGTSLEHARADTETIGVRLAQQYPAENNTSTYLLVPLREQVVGQIRPALMLLLGAVACVLLIACANVSNLMLARAATRQVEFSIRAALGASRTQIVRQMVTESLFLSTIGGLLGLGFAYVGVRALLSISAENIPRTETIGINFRVLCFTLVVSILTGLLLGILPALRSSNRRATEGLREGKRGSTRGVLHQRLLSALVISEIAIALVLLVGAGLLIRSFISLNDVNPGFNPKGVLTLGVGLPSAGYPDLPKQAKFYDEAISQIRTQPGVQSAAAIIRLPMYGQNANTSFTIEGQLTRPEDAPRADYRSVTQEYFKSMGIPLDGRDFTDREMKDAPDVVIINKTMAAHYFPGENPIGKRIQIFPDPDRWREIVGVCGDVKLLTMDGQIGPTIYVPMSQNPYPNALRNVFFVVKTASSPKSLVPGIRDGLKSLDRSVPLSQVRTMEEIVANSLSQLRLSMSLLVAFAILAAVLACVGIYGVMAYIVAQRTNEIGVRVALGAQGADVMKMVLLDGAKLTMLGVVIGLAASFGLTRLLVSLLFEVSPIDARVFVSIPLLLAFVALLASYFPARRAAKVDPIVALRDG